MTGMKVEAYKAKVEESVGGEKIKIEYPAHKYPYVDGIKVRVQAVFYNSTRLDKYLKLMDKDGDQFMNDVPGMENPHSVSPEHPVTIALPMYYMDEDLEGGNEIIIWGEMITNPKE